MIPIIRIFQSFILSFGPLWLQFYGSKMGNQVSKGKIKNEIDLRNGLVTYNYQTFNTHDDNFSPHASVFVFTLNISSEDTLNKTIFHALLFFMSNWD